MIDSYHRKIPVPSSLHWDADHAPALDAELDTSWPVADRSDRILTRNAGTRVVVSAPRMTLPAIARSTPIFTDLQVTESQVDTDRVRTILDAVETELEPLEREAFRYGVQYDGLQTISNTPERFLTDLDQVGRHLEADDATTSALKALTTDPTSPIRLTGAALWPVSDGWFYLEWTQRPDDDTARIQYGLLFTAPLLDPSFVIPFFEALTDDPPRFQGQWPCRQLIVSGSRAGASLTQTTLISDELVPPGDLDRPLMPLHGTNPCYGTDAETLDSSGSLPDDLYRPLQRISTLPYRTNTPPQEGATYSLDTITAVEPPTTRALFVSATASRDR